MIERGVEGWWLVEPTGSYRVHHVWCSGTTVGRFRPLSLTLRRVTEFVALDKISGSAAPAQPEPS